MNAVELMFKTQSVEEKEKLSNQIFDSVVKELVAKKKVDNTVGSVLENIPVEKVISFIAVIANHFSWKQSPDLANKTVSDVSTANPTGLK